MRTGTPRQLVTTTTQMTEATDHQEHPQFRQQLSGRPIQLGTASSQLRITAPQAEGQDKGRTASQLRLWTSAHGSALGSPPYLLRLLRVLVTDLGRLADCTIPTLVPSAVCSTVFASPPDTERALEFQLVGVNPSDPRKLPWTPPPLPFPVPVELPWLWPLTGLPRDAESVLPAEPKSLVFSADPFGCEGCCCGCCCFFWVWACDFCALFLMPSAAVLYDGGEGAK